MAFRYGLSWPEARNILSEGAFVRRERWTDKRLFGTPGALVWVDAVPQRVVQGADFGREEFLAKDWTDMGFDQGDCIEHPGWTRLLIDETAVVTVREYVPARTIMNPPSWGEPYIAPDGRRYNSRRIVDRVTGGWLWVHPLPPPPSTLMMEPVTYTTIGAIPATGTGPTPMLSRIIPNPFSAACSVTITGTASDALLLNKKETPLPASFLLAAGASFSLAALVRMPPSQPVADLNLVVVLAL